MRNKVVVITGGTSGIGKALALSYARQGANVALCGRSTDRLADMNTQLSALTQGVLCSRIDVTNEHEAKQFFDQVMDQFGRVDVLINNAGISMRSLFEQAKIDVLRSVMEVNFWGSVNITKYFLPEIIKSKGSLVGVSSIAGKKGLPARSGYSASKFAMEGFLECIRLETKSRGVHVLIACPSFTESNIRQNALQGDGEVQGDSPRDEGESMSAEEVAAHIVKAVKRRRRSVILTPLAWWMIFFNKWLPVWMDNRVIAHMKREKDDPLTQAEQSS